MSEPTPRGLCFDLARVTIQLDSPLTIGTGSPDDLRDAVCVTDPNGLPTIPGSSIAGVLRHLVAAGRDPDTDPTCRAVFGYQSKSEGQSSAVEVSWAHVHDAANQPVSHRPADTALDDVLVFLTAGIVRDHVRLNGFGAVDGDGKHDVGAVPVGARFTFELIVPSGCPRSVAVLVDLLHGPTARFGSGTRRGRGAFHVVSALSRSFDLRNAADRAALLRVPRDIGTPVPDGVLLPLPLERSVADGFVTATLELTPEDFWLIGGGSPEALGRMGDAATAAWPVTSTVSGSVDLAPLSEQRIVWREDRASIAVPAFVIPASAIKGPLRHRTAYHLRRLKKQWGEMSERPLEEIPELVTLFGSVKRQEAGMAAEDEPFGQPGRIVIDDVWPEAAVPLPIDHVSIDRFTGGPLGGHLFREAPLGGTAPIKVQLTVDTRDGGRGGQSASGGVGPVAWEALNAALSDLCEGRLALGGGGSRGHGHVRGTVRWVGDIPKVVTA